MSIEKLAALAEEFAIKVAEHHYDEHEPGDVKADDLTWLDKGERWLIRQNGVNDKYLPHNPPGAIASEKTWDRAKKAVKKYWNKYKEPWAVVFSVYRQMGGKLKKKKKKK